MNDLSAARAKTEFDHARQLRIYCVFFSACILVLFSIYGTFASQPLAGSYTINSGEPTGGSNFHSFSEAVSALTMNGISASVTFNVAYGSGPYTEHLSIPEIFGASSTSTIIFNGNGCTLRFGPSSLDYSIIDLNGADYITFNNLVIVGTHQAYGIGFLLRNQADYNRILNCTIDLAAITSTSQHSGYIIASGSVTSSAAIGNNANHCIIQSNTCIGGASGGPYCGIRLNGVFGTNLESNSIIENVIQDFYSYGIYLCYTSGTTVRGNDISRPNRIVGTTFYGIVCATASEAEFIEKNRVHDPRAGAPTSTSSAYGLAFLSPATPAGSETTIRNNLIYNMQGMGPLYGIYCSSASNVRIYHNTLSLDHASAVAGNTYGFYITGTTAPGPDLMNNIVTVTRGGIGTKYCIYVSGAGVVSSNYNDLYMNAPAGINYTGYYNGIPFATLPDWQTANGNAYDQQSVAANPMYEAPSSGNYRPLAVSVNNVGDNLSTAGCSCVTDDIMGIIRCANPDLGAYEYTEPPVAKCKNVEANADAFCRAVVTLEQIDDGSYDPDGDPITISVLPEGPYLLGTTQVTLKVTDCHNLSSTCTAYITVVDKQPPVITTILESYVLWPPNHDYVTILVSQLVTKVTDNCPVQGGVGSVSISSVSSDEVEDDNGNGDGNTINDIIIAQDCRSVDVRRERDNTKNGRVYTINLKVMDDNGNAGYASAKVAVPHSQNGDPAVDDGPVYIVASPCTASKLSERTTPTPDGCFLSQNYPNPFNPTTSITYGIPEDGHVLLKVFDVHGRIVSELVNDMKQSGTYTVEFDGSYLPSGVYLYRLEVNGERRTHRMILMK